MAEKHPASNEIDPADFTRHVDINDISDSEPSGELTVGVHADDSTEANFPIIDMGTPTPSDGPEQKPLPRAATNIESNQDTESQKTTSREILAKNLLESLTENNTPIDEYPKTIKEILFGDTSTVEAPDYVLRNVIAEMVKQGNIETAERLSSLGSDTINRDENLSILIDGFFLYKKININNLAKYINSISTDAIRDDVISKNIKSIIKIDKKSAREYANKIINEELREEANLAVSRSEEMASTVSLKRGTDKEKKAA